MHTVEFSHGNAASLTINISDTTPAPAITTQPANQTGNGGGNGSTPSTPAYKAAVSGISTAGTALPVAINTSTGSAAADLGTLAQNIFVRGETATIAVPSIPDVSSYTMEMPAASLSIPGGEGALIVSTDTGSITVPANMLAGIPATEGKKAGITVSRSDKSCLPAEIKAAIGGRPVIQLTMTLDGTQTEWSNPNAPVAVSIPYTPTAAELANPESIVIWYIDGSGRAVSVPNGRYDAASGKVTFSTTHFSDFAVVYNKVGFNDVVKDAWYSRAVNFIAARGITEGTGSGNFSPEAKLTRGQFVVMLMKAYGIAPDANTKDNFSDAGDTYYTGYLAAAKRLGISEGMGSNMFVPGKEITRQEMFTMLYNALKAIGRLPHGDTVKVLSDFSDAGQIDSWARDAMALLVKTGTVSGSAGRLAPLNTATRAEMAQILYNLL